ncbi:uncharacterized protein LOC119084079 [Bradysia coprophila]|uniref:uncharacterized protein LOC119084079 n=1 Tax=Bradysia coprophila TaxID=38358 RepID=UPI00187D93E0|nr:uncharacterized protein LOC119084079 [Bradysia coprophila]
MITTRKVLIFVILIAVMASVANGKRKTKTKSQKADVVGDDRQNLLQSRETDPPNFLRLLLMRLIYGIAVQIGAEDRLAGFLNGIFVPPNADDDDGFGGLGGFLGEIGDGGGDDLFDF